MKTEKILTAWLTFCTAVFGCLTLVKHDTVRMSILCGLIIFTIILIGLMLARNRNDRNND